MHMPPISDPRWASLFSDGNRTFHNLGVQVLMARLCREAGGTASPDRLAQAIGELRHLLLEQGHLPSVREDMDAIFGAGE
jgi:hypothetical protein